jgi:hypothetical protein
LIGDEITEVLDAARRTHGRGDVDLRDDRTVVIKR